MNILLSFLILLIVLHILSLFKSLLSTEDNKLFDNFSILHFKLSFQMNYFYFGNACCLLKITIIFEDFFIYFLNGILTWNLHTVCDVTYFGKTGYLLKITLTNNYLLKLVFSSAFLYPNFTDKVILCPLDPITFLKQSTKCYLMDGSYSQKHLKAVS